MLIEKTETGIDREVISDLKEILGTDTKEKKEIFARLERGVESLEMDNASVKKKRRKLNIILGIAWSVFGIFLALALFFACAFPSSEFVSLFPMILTFVVAPVMILVVHNVTEKEAWLEYDCDIPDTGYFRKEDVNAINKMLEEKTSAEEMIAHRELTRYVVDIEGHQYDISKIIPTGSPEEVEVCICSSLQFKPTANCGHRLIGNPQVELVAKLYCEVIEHEVVVPEVIDNNPYTQKTSWLSQILSRF